MYTQAPRGSGRLVRTSHVWGFIQGLTLILGLDDGAAQSRLRAGERGGL